MSEDYTIEQLEKTFKEHSEEALKEQEFQIEKFKIMWPDDQLPSHMLNSFNISEALYVICKEINYIKNSIEHIKDKLF